MLCVTERARQNQIMTVDISSLWDFANPIESEQRFRDALATASGDDAIIIRTQIARTYSLRREFIAAREILSSIEPEMNDCGAEAKVRFYLEFGRTYASATHKAQELTAESRLKAKELYLRALAIAQDAQLDALAIDSLHMMAFVKSEPVDQLNWTRQALAIAEASEQESARKWEASLRNNVGYALHQLGQFEDALGEFERALVLREREGDAERIRIAQWMVAWTLRSLNRIDQALGIQLQLENEYKAIDTSDPYVFAELEQLYLAKGETSRAAHYAALQVK
jgi:tetratricopeptide (TPR) repeat protein